MSPRLAEGLWPPQSLLSLAAHHSKLLWGRPVNAEVQAQNRPWAILGEPPNFPPETPGTQHQADYPLAE